MQAAEHASLVVFGRVEVCHDYIIGIREGDMTGGAAWALAVALARYLATIRTIDAEDVADDKGQRKVEKGEEGSKLTCRL
jgi:hypothetical protein